MKRLIKVCVSLSLAAASLVFLSHDNPGSFMVALFLALLACQSGPESRRQELMSGDTKLWSQKLESSEEGPAQPLLRIEL